MTDTDTIEREHGDHAGRYVIRLPDEDAEMTYRRLSPQVISIDHTYVPPQHRERKLAMRLMEAAIADARAEGQKIVPRCSYVAAQFRRHPEWADLLAD